MSKKIPTSVEASAPNAKPKPSAKRKSAKTSADKGNGLQNALPSPKKAKLLVKKEIKRVLKVTAPKIKLAAKKTPGKAKSGKAKPGKASAKPQRAPVNLSELRQRIDQIDVQIQSLICERARYARRVGLVKGPLSAAIDYYRPERESQVLRMVVQRNVGPLSNPELVRVFREIMSACLAQQNKLKIAFLGPEGTFSQAAVQKHFGQSVQALPMAALDDVFQAVDEKDADFGVVPIENSTEGSVHNAQDLLVNSPLKICGEIELRIEQHLMSSGDALAKIERVYSHQQSLGQCKMWLKKNLPRAELIAVSSNAEAARRARGAPEAAAIAPEAAASIYGLKILRRNVEDRADNRTRFIVLGRQLFEPSGHDKTSLLLAGKDEPGLLYQLLDPLARAGVSMTRIESRPMRTGRWEYAFFIDVHGHIKDEQLKIALSQMGHLVGQLKILGSYPRAWSDA
jgi:chorismate mutase / prephenate dehydratase